MLKIDVNYVLSSPHGSIFTLSDGREVTRADLIDMIERRRVADEIILARKPKEKKPCASL